MPAHSPAIPDHTLSMAAHSPFMTAHSPSDVGLDAPASPLHIPMHTDATFAPSTENPRSIDGKSTLHRRRIHAPSTPLITGSTPLLYPPKRLASPTPHSHHRLRLPSFLLFFFSRILSHQFPIRSSPSTTISHRHTPSLTISFNSSLSIYITIIIYIHCQSKRLPLHLHLSLSLSQRTQTRSHTHLTLGKNKKRIPLFLSPLFYFCNFFFFSFLNNQRQHCTRDIMNPSRRECIVCV